MDEPSRVPRKYVSRTEEECNMGILTYSATIEKDHPDTLWFKEDESPITIGADGAGIGSGIEGVARVCSLHKVAFV